MRRGRTYELDWSEKQERCVEDAPYELDTVKTIIRETIEKKSRSQENDDLL